MIKTTLVAMTLLGCDCDANVCQFVSEMPAQWASIADCEAAMKTQVLRNSDLDFPMITGQCRVIGQSANELALQGDQDQPASTIDRRDLASASGSRSLVFERTANSYRIVSSSFGWAADVVFQTAANAASKVTPTLSRLMAFLPGD